MGGVWIGLGGMLGGIEMYFGGNVDRLGYHSGRIFTLIQGTKLNTP